LCSELDAAVRTLEKLDVDPIVVAASPNRFNDIFWSEWQAVRLGSFFTERHEYGGSRNYELDLETGPPGARAARDVLDGLENSSWRDHFADAFGITSWSDQSLALALQDGLPWLVFSRSNNTDENHVFALWDEQPVSYFGECIDRFDWEMQESPPLRFQEIKP
jgi:hypothetical protein